jgi:drug/metabolite transporter (DMT)-like permease
VAPFDYMQMVWATAIGFIIWLEIPTIHTLLGASVVILSGFYIFRREAAVRKKFA